MKNTSCERCNSQFFTAYNDTNTTCPFCGYSFFLTGESMIRTYKRSQIDRPCLLTGDDKNITVQARDISEGGIGIEAATEFSITKDEKVNIVIEDFDINSAALIKWITRENNALRAGLQFM